MAPHERFEQNDESRYALKACVLPEKHNLHHGETYLKSDLFNKAITNITMVSFELQKRNCNFFILILPPPQKEKMLIHFNWLHGCCGYPPKI